MKFAIYTLLFILFAGGLIYQFGPKEPIRGPLTFDRAALASDVDLYLYEAEQQIPNLVRGAQKHVLWADPSKREKTEWAIVYIHGFSATSFEIRPVPALVAEALGANLHYTRLAGHGRDGAAMAEGSVPAWMNDVAEALAVGKEIGEKVLVIGTSTGGTLATMAAFDARMNADIDAIAMVSPNFGLKARGASLLTLPFSRSFVPMLVGAERSFVPQNEEHGKRWTMRYPISATIPLAHSAKAAYNLPLEEARHPALFLFSDADTVVDAARTRAVAARWGAPAALYPVSLTSDDDPSAHVIAGEILSPNQSQPIAEQIYLWVTGLPR